MGKIVYNTTWGAASLILSLAQSKTFRVGQAGNPGSRFPRQARSARPILIEAGKVSIGPSPTLAPGAGLRNVHPFADRSRAV